VTWSRCDALPVPERRLFCSPFFSFLLGNKEEEEQRKEKVVKTDARGGSSAKDDFGR
jgi:hypothetical protein